MRKKLRFSHLVNVLGRKGDVSGPAQWPRSSPHSRTGAHLGICDMTRDGLLGITKFFSTHSYLLGGQGFWGFFLMSPATVKE